MHIFMGVLAPHDRGDSLLSPVAPPFHGQGLHLPSFSVSFNSAAVLSMLLTVYPFSHLTDRDRLPQLCSVVPVTVFFDFALHAHLAHDPS